MQVARFTKARWPVHLLRQFAWPQSSKGVTL
jgi:hypothetical protein